MSDDRWRDTYDTWKLATPPEYEPQGGQEDERPEAPNQIIARQREEISALEATIASLRADTDAAVKWAIDYQRAHGSFKPEPREPAFMIWF